MLPDNHGVLLASWCCPAFVQNLMPETRCWVSAFFDVGSVLVLLFLFCDVVVGILSRAVLHLQVDLLMGILWDRLV